MRVTLLFASNVKTRVKNVEEALKWANSVLRSFSCSQIYETESFYKENDSRYSNAVCIGDIDMEVSEFILLTKQYEKLHGRIKPFNTPEIDVEIDIDVVMADNVILRPKDYARPYFRIGYNEI